MSVEHEGNDHLSKPFSQSSIPRPLPKMMSPTVPATPGNKAAKFALHYLCQVTMLKNFLSKLTKPSGLVSTLKPAILGSNPEHAIYALSEFN